MCPAPRQCASLRPARPADLEPVLNLLQSAALPAAGVEQWLPHFVVAEYDKDIVAAAGLELYADSALLRSVVVREDWRGSGLGRQVVDALLADARGRGIEDVYLLTTTADLYFPKVGFACITREEVPPTVRESVEFKDACPASATVMRRKLERSAT